MIKKLFWCLISLEILFLFGCASNKHEENYIQTPRGFYEAIEPNGDILEIDSFEYGLYWHTKNLENEIIDNDLSISCQIWNQWSSEGSSSLRCDFNQSFSPDETNATFIYKFPVETFWNNAKFILLVVNNPNKDCIYIAAGINNFQSEPYLCPPGQHLLLIDISDCEELFKETEPRQTFIVESPYITVTNVDMLSKNSKCFYVDNYRLLMDNSKHIETPDTIKLTQTDNESE